MRKRRLLVTVYVLALSALAVWIWDNGYRSKSRGPITCDSLSRIPQIGHHLAFLGSGKNVSYSIYREHRQDSYLVRAVMTAEEARSAFDGSRLSHGHGSQVAWIYDSVRSDFEAKGMPIFSAREGDELWCWFDTSEGLIVGCVSVPSGDVAVTARLQRGKH